MNKQSFISSLTTILIIFSIIAVLALPVFPVKAQAQYTKTMQSINVIQLEIEKVKAGIINILGEMANIIAEEIEELTLEFDKSFNLTSETEEELETATSTATTTEQ